MKIFSWIQSKLNGKQASSKPNLLSANHHILQTSSKEEFSDWPNVLLAIGTFGNNNIKEEAERLNLQGSEASCQDNVHDIITPEEVGELQKELKLIVDKQVLESSSPDDLETHNLRFEKIFNSSSNLETENTVSDKVYDDIEHKEKRPLQRSNSAVLSRGKDSRLDTTNNAISKKSLSFLLKKMFICRSGFTPTPSLRDPLPDSILEKSRMEKIFRAILNKKIYPQRPGPKDRTAKKYLQNKQYCMTDSDDEMFEVANDGSKWDKTDSEYIVLEI